MRLVDIEAWALRVLDCLSSGQQLEDSRVELKREWPDATKAARRLAGHANAQAGETLLWLVGADETHGVLGAANSDLAKWWAQVSAEFDGFPPRLQDLVVHHSGQAVVALAFETDRPPYLVRNPSGGTIQREVPWRDATGIRTANRSDLVRLLAPVVPVPDIEILGARFYAIVRKDSRGIAHLTIHFYLVPRSPDRAVMPFHRCRVDLFGNDNRLLHSFENVRLGFSHHYYGGQYDESQSHTISISPTELILTGPGQVSAEMHYREPEPEALSVHAVLRAEVSLHVVGARSAITMAVDLQSVPMPPESQLTWTLGGAG